MPQDLLLHRAGREPERFSLGVPATAGGSQADTIPLLGLPSAAVRLEPCAAGVVVTAAVAGVRVAGHALAPGSRRLLRPGEHTVVLGAAIEVVLRSAEGGTRVQAAALLRDAAAGEAPPPGPHLVVLTGPAAGHRLGLGPAQVLGRGRGADIRLADPVVSRRHARLRLGTGGAVLEDLGAKNGVRVNGIRVDRRRPRPLAPGDEIGIGDTVLALTVPGEPNRPDRAPGAASLPEAPRAPVRRRRGRSPLAAAALLAISAAALLLAGS